MSVKKPDGSKNSSQIIFARHAPGNVFYLITEDGGLGDSSVEQYC
jgi:hypothetical protein